jgi:RimJ/RimL family protein N-acetyltransferase
MIATRFLTYSEYTEYADWLKGQDSETLHQYFGMGVSDAYLESLVKDIVDSKHNHYFLVAEERGIWVGTIHIAVQNIDEVEFGVMVASNRRKQGIANLMLQEAITWSRNRGFHALYMHCVSWNTPIKRLCIKHGLIVKNHYEDGESETKMPLLPPNLITIGQEIANTTRSIYTLLLQRNLRAFEELYG